MLAHGRDSNLLQLGHGRAGSWELLDCKMRQAVQEIPRPANGHSSHAGTRMKPGSKYTPAPERTCSEARTDTQTVELGGWGRYPTIVGREVCSENLERCTRNATLSRGLGRSYGDSSLPCQPGACVAGTRLADRILAFDETSGLLKAEAGLSLCELNRLFLPRGWAVPVSPGTQFVTLGGMVAADVHGKNHHRAGCFGEHVRGLV